VFHFRLGPTLRNPFADENRWGSSCSARAPPIDRKIDGSTTGAAKWRPSSH
jgi:hypothetical protein